MNVLNQQIEAWWEQMKKKNDVQMTDEYCMNTIYRNYHWKI